MMDDMCDNKKVTGSGFRFITRSLAQTNICVHTAPVQNPLHCDGKLETLNRRIMLCDWSKEMASFSWWRSWHGAPTDLKWQVISARSGVKAGVVSAVAWALLDYASQNDPRGSIEGFDVELYSVYSGFSEDEINAVMRVMGDKDVIADGKLVNWEKRQPKREDNSSDRVTKFRELKRSVTQRNAPEKIREDKTRLDKISINGDNKVVVEGQKIEIPAAAPETFSTDPADRIWRKIKPASLVIPPTLRETTIPVIDLALKRNGGDEDKTAVEGKTYFDAWCKRRGKDGKYYSPSGRGWIDWWAQGEIPAQHDGNSGAGFIPTEYIT